MSEISDVVDLVLVLAGNIADSPDDEQRANYKTYGLTVVDRLLRTFPTEPNLHYARGYLLYSTAVALQESLQPALLSLTNALSWKPDHQFARFYRAAARFLENDYRAVLEDLNALDYQYFTDIDLRWRAVKGMELSACCYGYLGQAEDFQRSVRLLCRELAFRPDEDDLIEPNELAKCLLAVHLDGSLDGVEVPLAREVENCISQNDWPTLPALTAIRDISVDPGSCHSRLSAGDQ